MSIDTQELDKVLLEFCLPPGTPPNYQATMLEEAEFVKAQRAISALIESAIQEARKDQDRRSRKDELIKANTWALSHNLNDASKHKWYVYYSDRVARNSLTNSEPTNRDEEDERSAHLRRAYYRKERRGKSYE